MPYASSLTRSALYRWGGPLDPGHGEPMWRSSVAGIEIEHREEPPPFVEKWPRWQRAGLLFVAGSLCWLPLVTLALAVLD